MLKSGGWGKIQSLILARIRTIHKQSRTKDVAVRSENKFFSLNLSNERKFRLKIHCQL